MAEWIMKEETDMDGVGCYIRKGELIRCKDCKWYYRGGATCMFWDGTNGMCGDDFCGRAERKEE